MPGNARAWTVAFLVAGASAAAADAVPPPVVVQGAMPIEVDKLARRLDGVAVETVGAWTFWRGTLDGRPVVVSKTLKGGANAAAATALAVERFHPAAILNQGTAGGHDPALRVYDVVLGASAVSLAAFKSPYRGSGAGSAPLEWVPLALTASEGSAGNDPRAQKVARFAGDEDLLAAARRVAPSYKRGRVVEGVIGSSDSWNSEIDLIASYRARFGTSVEEMETAPAAQIAALLKVPFLGIRVVSNNITNGDGYDAGAAAACQDFVYEVVRAYLRTQRPEAPGAAVPTR
jgi:adenosylhomocysteine nucleosidase